MRTRGEKRPNEVEKGERRLATELDNTLARVPETEFGERTRHFYNKWQEAITAPQIQVLKPVLASIGNSGGRLPARDRSARTSIAKQENDLAQALQHIRWTRKRHPSVDALLKDVDAAGRRRYQFSDNNKEKLGLRNAVLHRQRCRDDDAAQLAVSAGMQLPVVPSVMQWCGRKYQKNNVEN